MFHCGKSTLFRLIRGEIKSDGGEVSLQSGKTLGFVEQEIASSTQPALLTFLGRFGLAGNSEERPVESFSGGEKSRLALALLAWQKPHLLLLDEPTNHLDLDMRDALTLALEEYTGAVVLVSHDRSLIRAVADELWLVADNTAKLFDGDLEDYKEWIETRRKRDTVAVKVDKPAQPAAPKPNRKALQSKLTKLETELGKAQAELSEINTQLGDPASYAEGNSDLIAKLNARRVVLEAKVAELEEGWLEMQMSLEG